MPYGIRKQPCTDSNGNKGNYVLYLATSGRKVSCHKTRSDAQAARRAREANEKSKYCDEHTNITLIHKNLNKIKKLIQ